MENEFRITAGDERARRMRRATWPVRQFDLGSEPNEDLSLVTSVEERIAMMWPLALDAFGIGAVTSPSTPRHTWPISMRRLGDPEAP